LRVDDQKFYRTTIRSCYDRKEEFVPFNGAAFGLPFTMNTVEGTEASLFVTAAASRAG
jgi:hypothetical protein